MNYIIQNDLSSFIYITNSSNSSITSSQLIQLMTNPTSVNLSNQNNSKSQFDIVHLRNKNFINWTRDYKRLSELYYFDIFEGHNYLSTLYLKHCSNKSIAVDHPWQTYLKTYGPSHLHR